MVSTSDVEFNRNSDPLDHIPSPTLPNFPGSDQLPSAVLRRILNYTIHRIVNSGGNDVSYVVMRLTRMALVCRGWRKVAYLERKKGWMKADYEGNDRAFKELDCLYSVSQIGKSCTKGGVHFVIRDCEGRTENRRWDEDVTALVLACSNTMRATWECYNARRLNLSFMFRALKTLSIEMHVDTETMLNVYKPINLIFHPLPQTLSRLDLCHIDIPSWDSTLPSLKTLTLHHVNFAIANSPRSRTSKVCRQFFDSFPSLTALGINGISGMDSTALSLLPPSLVHLALGPCAFPSTAARCSLKHKPEPFLAYLARHLRCKIKHLVLSNSHWGVLFFKQLVESREDGKLPIYLRGLETIKIAAEGHWIKRFWMGREQFGPDGPFSFEWLQQFTLCAEADESELFRICTEHQIPRPLLRRWQVEETDNPLKNWEPKEWS
ncbi:hypothetical protein JCM5353_006066 [Sporobolomyces roseus]